MPIRILLADDHQLLRQGLRALLATVDDLEVVGDVGSGAEALRATTELRPDVLLLDVDMPPPGGLAVCERLRDEGATARALILSMHQDAALLHGALRAGAAGYCVKGAERDELVTAIRAVHRGELYVHPSLTHALLRDRTAGQAASRGDIGARLTPRELDVLGLLADGHTNAQMARALGIGLRTVEGYRAGLIAKLGAPSRVELIRIARTLGLLP